jgi:hypothetical protein
MLGHRFEGAGFIHGASAIANINPSSQEVYRMRVSTAHSRSRTWSQRAAWLFAASALALTLALGGCRAGAHNTGSQTPPQSQQAPSGAPTPGSTTGSNNSSSLQQLENIDSQDQNDSQQLNSAQSNAGVNYSSQENNTLP